MSPVSLAPIRAPARVDAAAADRVGAEVLGAEAAAVALAAVALAAVVVVVAVVVGAAEAATRYTSPVTCTSHRGRSDSWCPD